MPMTGDAVQAETDVPHFTFLHVKAGEYDVCDWPNPGDWAGLVEARRHRTRRAPQRHRRAGFRWFPQRRGPEGGFTPVGDEHGYATRQEAAEALIGACAHQMAGPGHVVDVPVSASEPNRPKAGGGT